MYITTLTTWTTTTTTATMWPMLKALAGAFFYGVDIVWRRQDINKAT